MKTKNYLFVSFIIVSFQALAQPCINNITTDPRTNWATATSPPYDQSWKKNLFNWFLNSSQTTNNVYAYNQVRNQPIIPLKSPFSNTYATEYAFLAPLHSGSYPDMYPEDGWELVKQDFGIFEYDNTTIAPTLVTFTPGGYLQNNGPSYPYIILYNKFSGMLRVLGHVPNSSIQNFIEVSLSFFILKDDNPNTQDFPDISGLLNTYGNDDKSPKNTLQNALDKPSRGVVKNVVPLPADGTNHMFFADFNVSSYDPCTCQKNSVIQVGFRALTYSPLVAFGFDRQFLDTKEPNFLVSTFSDASGTVNGGILQYTDPQSFQDNIKKLISDKVKNASENASLSKYTNTYSL